MVFFRGLYAAYTALRHREMMSCHTDYDLHYFPTITTSVYVNVKVGLYKPAILRWLLKPPMLIL